MAENFPAFLLDTGSEIFAAIGLMLLADSSSWHTATNPSEFECDTYSCNDTIATRLWMQ